MASPVRGTPGSKVVAKPVAETARKVPIAPVDTKKAEPPNVGWSSSGKNTLGTQLRALRAELEDSKLAQRLDLNDPQERAMLLADAGQVNPLSQLTGNEGDICAGAAVVNAMLLNPSGAKANAAALEKAGTALGAFKPPVNEKETRAALGHLAEGKLNPYDVQHLQQLAYSMMRSVEGGDGKAGTNPAVLGAVLSQLASAGAQLPGTRFTQIRGNGTGHWLVEANGTFANSLPGTWSKNASPAPSAPAWDSDVAVSAKGIDVRLRGGGALPDAPRGKAYQFSLDPKTDSVNLFTDLGALRGRVDQRARGAVPSAL